MSIRLFIIHLRKLSADTIGSLYRAAPRDVGRPRTAGDPGTRVQV